MDVLAAPGVFSFIVTAIELPPSDEKLRNTYELFAFGSLRHYHRHQHQCVPLTPELQTKLLQLSLISISNDYDGLEVPIATVAEEYGVPTGLELDTAIITMVDNNWVDIKMKGDSLVVGPAQVFRDSYDPAIYQLRLFSEDEIAARLVPVAKDRLQRWFDDKVVAVRDEYQQEATKKRKPSDRNE